MRRTFGKAMMLVGVFVIQQVLVMLIGPVAQIRRNAERGHSNNSQMKPDVRKKKGILVTMKAEIDTVFSLMVMFRPEADKWCPG